MYVHCGWPDYIKGFRVCRSIFFCGHLVVIFVCTLFYRLGAISQIILYSLMCVTEMISRQHTW